MHSQGQRLANRGELQGGDGGAAGQRDQQNPETSRLWCGRAWRRCRRWSPAAFISRQRANGDVQVAVAQHFRRSVSLPISRGGCHKAIHDLKAKFLVGALPSPKTELDPHFHVVTEEFDSVIELGVKIVLFDGGSELKLLHSVPAVMGMGLFLALGFLVKQLAVFSNAADGWHRVGDGFDEIEALALGQTQGIAKAHHAELLSGIVNDANFAGADFPVSAMLRFAGRKGTRNKRAAQFALTCLMLSRV